MDFALPIYEFKDVLGRSWPREGTSPSLEGGLGTVSRHTHSDRGDMYAGSLGAPSSSTHLSAWFLGSSLDECECLIRSCLNLYNVLQRIYPIGGGRNDFEVGKDGR